MNIKADGDNVRHTALYVALYELRRIEGTQMYRFISFVSRLRVAPDLAHNQPSWTPLPWSLLPPPPHVGMGACQSYESSRWRRVWYFNADSLRFTRFT